MSGLMLDRTFSGPAYQPNLIFYSTQLWVWKAHLGRSPNAIFTWLLEGSIPLASNDDFRYYHG